MQINISTCYAMQIMLYLTRSIRITSSSELSDNLCISQRYILQIAGKLRDGGFVNAHNGMSGGYSLSIPSSDISIYDIINLMEGDMSIPECITRTQDCGESCIDGSLFNALSTLKDLFETYLKSLKFSRLVSMEMNGNLSEILGLVNSHIREFDK